MKENVIIGRLVPIGSGFEGSDKFEVVKEVSDEVAKKVEAKKEEWLKKEQKEEEKEKIV